jgi:predicted extracellular nuclease
VSNSNAFGEADIVASLGAGATGINARGGITISPGDYNPERIQLDDRLAIQPVLSVGDQLADVTGVIGYSFDRYELLATGTATVASDNTPVDEVTALRGDANHVTVAAYNLENLDPGDGKYACCPTTSSTACARRTSSRCRRFRTRTARAGASTSPARSPRRG